MTAPLRVGFQGEPGAYSEEAALALFGRDVEAVPCDSFDQVFEGVERALFDYGVVPVENSLAGSIHRNYDLLLAARPAHHRRAQPARVPLPHCASRNASGRYPAGLLPPAGAGPVRAVAECACRVSRSSPRYDTAGSVKMVKESGDPHAAAIASARAAEIYGMSVLAS